MKKAYWKQDWFIGLLLALIFILLANSAVIRNLEWQAYDIGMRFSSMKPASEDIVIVAIDEKSVQSLGAWPWPRALLADATRRIAQARPEVIGFTMPFDIEQSAPGVEDLETLTALLKSEGALTRSVRRALAAAESSMNGDQILAESFRSAGRIVLAMPYSSNLPVQLAEPPALADYLDKFTLQNIKQPEKVNVIAKWWQGEPVPVADVVYPPIEELSKQAGGAGVLNMGGGDAGHMASEPLVVRYGDKYLPSFSLMMAARNQRLSTNKIVADLGKSLALGDKILATDSKLHIYPRYYKSRDGEPAFKIYSIIDVLNNKISNSAFSHKTVVLGLTARQHVVPLMTPIGELMSPTVITAHTVSGLLNDELYRVPEWSDMAQKLIIIIVGFYLAFLLPRFRGTTGMVVSLMLLAAILNAQYILMIGQSTWLPLMAPSLALIIGHLVLGAKHFLESNVQQVFVELSTANQLLAQSFHAQGQLDLAFEKYRKCSVDESLLSQLYNLGLDYERKRQFNKAVSVFKFIKDQDKGYSDVVDRVARNEKVANAVVLGGGATGSMNNTIVSSSAGVQKPMLGRYQIDKEIGRGAMGMVYIGKDPKIGRSVAIKTMMLSQEFEGERLEEVKQRFFREAEAVGRLKHPNIVTVYDVGDDQELAYIAMDYLKGKDLTAYCDSKTLLPASQVFEIIIDVAKALEYAHQQHVVHRDIKPANIIYDETSRSTVVTDFGVACLTDSSKTKTGTVLGSPSYMSPEQLEGKKVDGRSDIFSLGVTLYQMLAGELPFIAESLATLMYKIIHDKHPEIKIFRPDLPPCVGNLLNKALHKDLDKRFQSGSQMADSMKRCVERLNAN